MFTYLRAGIITVGHFVALLQTLNNFVISCLLQDQVSILSHFFLKTTLNWRKTIYTAPLALTSQNALTKASLKDCFCGNTNQQKPWHSKLNLKLAPPLALLFLGMARVTEQQLISCSFFSCSSKVFLAARTGYKRASALIVNFNANINRDISCSLHLGNLLHW